MQVISAFQGGPEEYVRDGAHRKVLRPDACPICGKSGVMRAHGRYYRSVSGPGRIKSMLIWICRFLCLACRRTTSMLPDFAHPYFKCERAGRSMAVAWQARGWSGARFCQRSEGPRFKRDPWHSTAAGGPPPTAGP